jgi:V/A-type H+-transporting ATPase subunit I
MRRVGVVAPVTRAHIVFADVADAGVFQPDLHRSPADASLDDVLDAAQQRGRCVVSPGWIREADVDALRAAIAPNGGAVADLPGRRGLVPPTAHTETRSTAALRPLVTTYATVPYADVDPTWFAAIAYVLMFGMMFGDVGHGLGIVAIGIIAARARRGRLQSVRRIAPFMIGAGVASIAFGLLYGDAFGPTGLVPTLWIRPLDEPERLLTAGLIVGGVLLGLTFVLSIVNRWREGGPSLALYDSSGIAGTLLFVAVAMGVVGVWWSRPVWWWSGVIVGGVGVVLLFVGLLVRAGGLGGFGESFVELFDTLLRLGSNIVSFTRLAAFGLTHAVITEVVWNGTESLWRGAALVSLAAIALFVTGNAAAFALGALVAAIQALRLEYYELFSRLFAGSGEPFTPWHVPSGDPPATPPTAAPPTAEPPSAELPSGDHTLADRMEVT